MNALALMTWRSCPGSMKRSCKIYWDEEINKNTETMTRFFINQNTKTLTGLTGCFRMDTTAWMQEVERRRRPKPRINYSDSDLI